MTDRVDPYAFSRPSGDVIYTPIIQFSTCYFFWLPVQLLFPPFVSRGSSIFVTRSYRYWSHGLMTLFLVVTSLMVKYRYTGCFWTRRTHSILMTHYVPKWAHNTTILLFSLPLRDLSSNEIQNIASGAFSTLKDLEDLYVKRSSFNDPLIIIQICVLRWTIWNYSLNCILLSPITITNFSNALQTLKFITVNVCVTISRHDLSLNTNSASPFYN